MRSHCEPRARATQNGDVFGLRPLDLAPALGSGVADASPAAARPPHHRGIGDIAARMSRPLPGRDREVRLGGGELALEIRGRVVYDRVIWHWRMLLLPLS